MFGATGDGFAARERFFGFGIDRARDLMATLVQTDCVAHGPTAEL